MNTACNGDIAVGTLRDGYGNVRDQDYQKSLDASLTT